MEGRVMRYVVRLLPVFPVILLVLVCAGCPWPGQHLFTSADTSFQGFNVLFDGMAGGAPAAADDAARGDGNTSVREVVEPDIIRLAEDGLLYVLNQHRGLTIVDLDTEELLKTLPTFGYPRDLYIADDRAYVLVSNALKYTRVGNTISSTLQARLYVIDITAPAEASVLNTFDFEGDLVDSRLVGDILYAVSAQYAYYWYNDPGVGVGVAIGDGTAVAEPAPGGKQKTSASSWISSINIADTSNIHEVKTLEITGEGSVIHATNQEILIAAPQWENWDRSSTLITYIDISDPAGAMTEGASVEIQGEVADRYKMDVWQDVLRVVTSSWNQGQRAVHVTTVDLSTPTESLPIMGSTEIEGAAGETLFATRFDGPKGYVVTFLIKDPLFVLDLSNPADPKVLGELIVPGWSTHIEPRGDRLIALGVDDTGGRQVSVSLFDVSDPAGPSLVDRVSLGSDWSWSTAYQDPKAFTVLDDVIIVPFSGWSESKGSYDRMQFVSYTPNDLEVQGAVDLEGSVLRSLKHQDAYYGVTTEQLAVIDVTQGLGLPKVANTVTLAEYVAAYAELADGSGIEFISHNDWTTTLVRGTAGETTVDVGNLSKTFVYGADSVVLVGTDYDEKDWTSYYLVAIVNFAEASSPRVTGPIRINVNPYWDYYWGWYRGGGGWPEDDVIAFKDVMPYYPGPSTGSSDTVFLMGDDLVLRCSANQYDSILGDDDAYQGLAIVDLAADDEPAVTTVGLGYDAIESLNVAGNKLYLGTVVDAGLSLQGGLVAHYIREIGLNPISAGPATNVPGTYLQYDPSTDVLVLMDNQWNNFESSALIKTVSWNGSGIASLVDSAALPATGAGSMAKTDGKIYFDSYDYEKGQMLYAITIASSGALTLSEGILVSEDWGAWLLGANGDKAYLSFNGGAIARYDFSGDGAYGALTQFMGSPMSLYHGAETAFAITGYSGLVTLP